MLNGVPFRVFIKMWGVCVPVEPKRVNPSAFAQLRVFRGFRPWKMGFSGVGAKIGVFVDFRGFCDFQGLVGFQDFGFLWFSMFSWFLGF